MSIRIRMGTAADLDAYADLLETVHRGMTHPEWFYVDSREAIRDQMDRGIMKLWLAMDGQQPAGALSVLLPGLEPENYGYELNFSREDLLRTVNMDSVAVLPDYRGQGLQRRLLEEAENWLSRGGDRILLCTIHPDNVYSLRNAVSQGYGIRRRISIYGSVRWLLQKNI